MITRLLFLSLFFIQNTFAQQVTGILGAFPPELVVLEGKMTSKTDTVISQVRFIKGFLDKTPVVLAQTGVGKVNAAITTTIMIEHFKPREIIFSGIAGGIDPTLHPGDIVIGTKVTYHDFGAIEGSGMKYWATKNPFTQQENPIAFQCDSALVQKALTVSNDLSFTKIPRQQGDFPPSVKKGVIATGDVFVSSENVTKRLWKDLKASATEMEGAAIAQACYQRGVPFLIIRSLSDKANDKARTDMNTFLNIAAKNAATLVMAVVAVL